MSDLLGRLDAAIDGLCPCGAEPRPDSAYCSYDCEPNHRGTHSQAETDGTQMRWRPDMVTEADDTGLTPIPIVPGHGIAYTGRHNGTVYRRNETTWHLRLDDGYRYVGTDVPAGRATCAHGATVLDEDTTTRIRSAWERLERELGNTRHLEPEQPRTWQGHAQEFYRQPPLGHALNQVENNGVNVIDFGADPTGQNDSTAAIQAAINSAPSESTIYFPTGRYSLVNSTPWDDPHSNPLADIQALMTDWVTDRTDAYLAALEAAVVQVETAGNAYLRAQATPEHPMLAAIEARRHRNTGPAHQPRAPRNLGPRRRR